VSKIYTWSTELLYEVTGCDILVNTINTQPDPLEMINTVYIVHSMNRLYLMLYTYLYILHSATALLRDCHRP